MCGASAMCALSHGNRKKLPHGVRPLLQLLQPSDSVQAQSSCGNCYSRTVIYLAAQMFSHDSPSCPEH